MQMQSKESNAEKAKKNKRERNNQEQEHPKNNYLRTINHWTKTIVDQEKLQKMKRQE